MSAPDVDSEELVRLRRRLERESARRAAAETIGEQVTSDLYATIEELRRAQTELSEQADRQHLVSQVARRLGQVPDTESLLSAAAAETGALLGVDHCHVHLSDQSGSPSWGHWCAAGPPAANPPPPLPAPLVALLERDVPRGEVVMVSDAATDPRLAAAAAGVVEAVGGRALAATAVQVAALRVGWLLLVSEEPRTWTDREIALSDGIGQELASCVLRLRAAEQQESVRRLEELDRAKDALVSNVSHELRTPLTSIRGYVELLEAGDLGDLDPATAAAVRVISRNTERLGRLVENLLHLSAQDEHAALDLTDVDLGVLVDDSRQALRPATDERGLEVTVGTDPGLRPVRADRGQLEQVVLNLLSNAVKFTSAGGRVTITTENTEEGVALTVEDTGMGIPEQELAGVFSRFFRSSLSVAREIQGTGLGLALTRSIVELHGGRLSLSSVEGVGTTVRVDLPTEVAAG